MERAKAQRDSAEGVREGRNGYHINDCGSAATQAMLFAFMGECQFMGEQNSLTQITRSKKTPNKTSLQDTSRALLL